MTPIINEIADGIGNWICTSFEREYQELVFSEGITIEDIIFQILVECSRYAYLMNAERHPWTYYIEQDGLELELARKNLKRTLTYVDDRFELEQKSLLDTVGIELPGHKHDIQVKKGKYNSYDITSFQYWELKNIHDMDLVKAIVERRISSSKKISESRFRELSEQYDCTIKEFIKKANQSDEDMVFSSLVLFELERKYSFNYFYKLACAMEKHGITEMPDLHYRIAATAGSYKAKESILQVIQPDLFHEENLMIFYPMILQRERLIDNLSFRPSCLTMDMALIQLQEANIMANTVQSCISIRGREQREQCIRTWFVENTNIEDWASVFKEYNVFRTFAPDKEWNSARIKAARSFWKDISLDYHSLKSRYKDPNPENRP